MLAVYYSVYLIVIKINLSIAFLRNNNKEVKNTNSIHGDLIKNKITKLKMSYNKKKHYCTF